MKRGTICNVVYTPVTPSVLHPLCSHEMRVCDIWADSINITSVLYQFCSASSMRPDIAHRLACCDNLSSRRKGGEGLYTCTDRDEGNSFSSRFLRFETGRMNETLRFQKLNHASSPSFPVLSVTRYGEIYLSIEIHWILRSRRFETRFDFFHFGSFIKDETYILLTFKVNFFFCKLFYLLF